MKLALLSSLAASGLIASAAASLAGGFVAPVVEAAPAPAAPAAIQDTSWTGAYVGAGLGYAFGGKDAVGISDASTSRYIGTAGDLKIHGLNLGLNGGYLWQYKSFAFGPEVGYRGGNIKDSQNASVAGTNYDSESKVKNILTLSWKTGYVFNDHKTMVFGTAGFATGKVDYSINGDSQNFTKSGYVVGLGVEHKIDQNWSVVGQYEYYNFGKKERTFGDIVTEATPKFSNISVGVNYRF